MPSPTLSKAGVEAALAPCPFCGGTASLSIYQLNYNARGWVIRCNGDTCAVKPFADLGSDRAEAIAKWNRRAAAQTTEAPVERCSAVRIAPI